MVAAVAAWKIHEAWSLVPIVDHHQHLTSPQSLLLITPLPQPAIALPSGLAQLLEKRGRLWNNPDATRQLLTDDIVVLDTQFPKWVRGAEQSAYTLGWPRWPPRPYVLRPVAYRDYGNIARIHGVYLDADSADRIIGFFDTIAERGADGSWRIAAETPSYPERPPPEKARPVSADELVSLLDEAGIRKAVVYSNANNFDGLMSAGGDEYAAVRAENDWVAAQVMRHPDRLIGFCSFNPRKEHAVTELTRCTRNKAFRGVKLHFGNSAVDLDNPRHVAEVRKVFEAANRLGWSLNVHTNANPRWGTRQASIFLNQLVVAAPDVQVVVNHLTGGAFNDEQVLEFFAEQVSSGKPAARNLYFEVAQLPFGNRTDADYEWIVKYMRQIGLERIYYGSDGPTWGGMPPKKMWRFLRNDLPLTASEFRVLAGNVAPWAR
jgi:predicted TIM-barrel fold metal-dependent hydrolase